MRWALPEWTIAVVSAVLTFAAALSVGWWVALPCLLGVPALVIGLRWYLARAKDGYLRESASYSVINATLTETVEGARTVEALGIGEERIGQIDDDIKESYDAEKYTLFLRTVFFPNMEIAYLIPTVLTLVFGGWLYTQGSVSLGDVTAATLYVQMLIDPVDRIVSILDEATSLIDPRAARHLERSLAAVLHGRTVIAIAHRLFSAHDADRVAVVEDGVISEFGSHDELVSTGGSYAALWDSWNGHR